MKMITNKILNRKIKKVNKVIKESIDIKQVQDKLIIKGSIDSDVWNVKSILLIDRVTGFQVTENNQSGRDHFVFTVKFSDLIDNDENGTIYDAYLNMEKEIDGELNSVDIHDQENDKTIRLGRFKSTTIDIDEITNIGADSYQLYTTIKGNISISVNKKVNNNLKVRINKMNINNQKMNIEGLLTTGQYKPTEVSILALGRVTTIEYTHPVEFQLIEELSQKKYGLNHYRIEVDTDFNKLFLSDDIREDIYDLFFVVKIGDTIEPFKIRIGNPKFKNKKFAFNNYLEKGELIYSITPYLTIKKFNLSLQIDEFEKDAYLYLKKMMKWGWILRLLNLHRDIWVVGERPYKAQDTGFHFFKYMRENHTDKEVYYVIEKDSPEYENLEELGNALIFKSKEHIKYTFLAKWLIGSHHVDYIYPSRTADFKQKIKGKKVFLQHGILGTKNTVHFYGKNSPSFDADLFVVSSDYEKSIVINDFGYAKNEVAVTGLSRFDSLFEENVAKKRQILIIPTWREWLVSTEKFLESEYLERYQSLINNEKLHQLAEQHQFEIVFCLHPNMQVYTHFFSNDNIKFINQGEVDVQYLMKESAMMITDFSSVAFDFSFLNRPVIYYQFDRMRFIGKKGSHLDLDEELPGDIVGEESEVIQAIENYASNNFEMRKENQIKSNKFLKYRDRKSSERIYNAIMNYKSSKKVRWNWRSSLFIQKAFRRFRKSKFYFPVMKFLYNIARVCLPVDKNLIIFESGIGKQYSDSPRYIYEEILKRKLPYKKVWIYNGTRKFRDPNTKVVTRLSPLYYYYLAKAGYWVNNQNFPTYIKKPDKTTYLQTWHGTPLKKMLFDIETIQGRSDDYLERVYQATKTWDYLLSPSAYATNAFKSAFKYEGEILEIGYPRNDLFYKEDNLKVVNKLKSKLFLPKDKKIILYAPTFRDNQVSQKNKFIFDINMDLLKMKEELGEDYIILLRMHVVISNRIVIPSELKDFVFNVSNYSEIQELYLLADILITDYSSVMFDYANTKKPMLFYTFDLEEYRDHTRGFYMNFEKEAPGPLVFNTEEIIDNIKQIDQVNENYKEKYSQFYNKYCYLEDGKASERVVDKIFEK